MNNKKIIVPRRKRINAQCQITLTPEAVECLIEVLQETGLSVKNAASTIIVQAVRGDMIVYEDTEEVNNEADRSDG